MMGGISKNEKSNNAESKFNQEIYSNVIRAGKRTYFFDVKSTRNDEFYLTITESKKRYEHDGKFHYEKHKVFLYKEDFDKFMESLEDVIGYIKENQPVQESLEETISEVVDTQDSQQETEEEPAEKDYTSVEFEDLTNS